MYRHLRATYVDTADIGWKHQYIVCSYDDIDVPEALTKLGCNVESRPVLVHWFDDYDDFDVHIKEVENDPCWTPLDLFHIDGNTKFYRATRKL